MKNKRLIILVSIVALLIVLNVAFYSYIRINNLKEIKKGYSDYENAKETSITEGELANLNDTDP